MLHRIRVSLFTLWFCSLNLFSQEQIITNELSLGELRAGQSLQLSIVYDTTNSEKTAGLGLRLHFDSSKIELGDLTERLTESVLPFQIKDDTTNLDNNSDTDKYFLTAWADTSGQGWPYNSDLPITLYSLPVTAKENFNSMTFQFTGYTAVGYSLTASDIVIPLAVKPVISLIGQSEVSLELGTTYTDSGATASDNIDGDITSSILTASNVNVNRVGTYSVTYNVSDAAGNAADEVTRTVNITPDVTKPVITLKGDMEVSLELGTPYTDLGAMASDNIDGDITSSIVTVNNVDIYTVGTYSVTYNVSDAAGNAADEVTRIVNITPDVTKPVITLSGDAEVSLELGAPYTDLGATASDNIDGDITSSIVTVNNVDIYTVGTYSVTYNVNDAAGNAADEATRTVNITPDLTKPVITITGGDIDHEQGTPYTDLGATALDNIDGDITSSISVENNVDSDIAGTYTIIYNVSDSSGNTADQKTRTVVVSDTTRPVINLIGDSEINLLVDDIYVDDGATAVDNIDGDITNQIITVNPVNTSEFGTYVVTYNVKDSSGNEATEVTRSVYIGGTLDVDGNGRYDALTDGLLILRYMFGLDGETLIIGTVASDATLKTPAEIEAQIELTYPLLDVDGNSIVDPLTDGLLIIRYLFELRGDTLILGVIASDATRLTAEEIEAHLARMVPNL